jgi:hypothetical protein
LTLFYDPVELSELFTCGALIAGRKKLVVIAKKQGLARTLDFDSV